MGLWGSIGIGGGAELTHGAYWWGSGSVLELGGALGPYRGLGGCLAVGSPPLTLLCVGSPTQTQGLGAGTPALWCSVGGVHGGAPPDWPKGALAFQGGPQPIKHFQPPSKRASAAFGHPGVQSPHLLPLLGVPPPPPDLFTGGGMSMGAYKSGLWGSMGALLHTCTGVPGPAHPRPHPCVPRWPL